MKIAAGILLAFAVVFGMPTAVMPVTQVVAQEAADADTASTVPVLDLEDGAYLIDVTMSGGSGKASIESPTEMTVQSGKAYAKITFSSPNYDYMIVDDVTFLPDNTDGNSVFHIPITVFDSGMEVVADTTAMSTPHEITYTLNFVSSSIKSGKAGIPTASSAYASSSVHADGGSLSDDEFDAIWGAMGYMTGACIGITVLIVGIIIVIILLLRKKKK